MSNIEHSLTFNDRGDRILVNTERPQIWQLAGSREYRTFSGDPSRRNKTPYGGSISSNGRFLAVGSEDGTVIWELETGLELAYLRTGRTWNVLFHSSGDLLTTGEKGLLHWRIRSIPGTGQYRIEPPDPLIKEWTDGVSQSKDGHIVAVAISQKGCQIIDLNRPGELKPLFSHPGINKCSVSHDGAWVATGCFRNSGIKIWSVYDHQFVRDLPIEGGATPYFSADGRWLATNSGAGLQLWKVGTWELGRSVPNGRCLFSPDGSHLAIVRDTTITLMDPNTGRTFATVEDPNQDRIDNAFFSPDGSQLVASNDEKSSVNVWDLRLIRSGLKTLKLDWDLPDFSEPPVPNPSAVPIKMSGMGSLADQSASRLDPVKKTVLDLYLNPFDADAHLRLSDVLLRAGKSDTGRAHLLAALAFDPNLANTSSSSVRDALQMSGEALIRQSRWKEASADFSRLVQLEPQNSYRYLQAATLLLASGDRTGYQRMAKRMLDRFRNTNVPYEADHTAKACLITGDFQSEQAALARLAEVAETRGRNANSYRLYYQLCRGLSEYRQGRYSSALEWFARSRKTNTEEVNPIICPVAMNNLFEAMALHNLGRSEEARQSMVTAKSVIDNFGGPTTHFRSDWHEWLLCDVVRKEAERLLSEK
jgi:tetratricopeptide (TPR) repeat protein/outer membrane protein assembly factor BamB